MRIIGRFTAVATLAALVAIFGFSTAASADPGTILKFSTMTPVTGPYVGASNPIRGLKGGGVPWIIESGRGSLDRDGHLKVRVNGLVLAPTHTNPVAMFKAIVSCQSIGADGSATIVNVSTGTFPANTEGDSHIKATVQLPTPCIAPIVFVTSPGGAWFAATGS